MKKIKSIDIAACTDHRFIMLIGVMIHSVCRNNNDLAVHFHLIVDESVTEEDKQDLKEVADGMSVQFYAIDSRRFSSMPLLKNITLAAYYRILLPQVLPEDIHKVLYLDGDIIVRHSLLPLWETEIDGYALAAVTDTSESDISIYNRLKYSPSLGYFNSGVLLINLDYWRANNIDDEIESFIKNHLHRVHYPDQDILNYVLRKKKKFLPIKYNTQTCFLWVPEKALYDYWKYEKEILEAREDPVIVHYTCTKPWIEGSFHPYKSTFLKYLSQTKWKGCIWKAPKRPFMVKVHSHLMNNMAKLGLFKATYEPTGNEVFVDGLPPID